MATSTATWLPKALCVFALALLACLAASRTPARGLRSSMVAPRMQMRGLASRSAGLQSRLSRMGSSLQRNVPVLASNTNNPDYALLFDCDGVIVLTEELHRLAYNAAFQQYKCEIDGKAVDWSVPHYDLLQNTVGGGKPKMKWHFNKYGWPTSTEGAPAGTEDEQQAMVDKLQDAKTEYYKKIVEEVAEARPGVLELMDEALANPKIACGICSAATKAGFEKVVNSVVGEERLAKFDVVMAGDDVVRKKPDPLIYNLAREKIGLPKEKCVVVEDSIVGLKAAKDAGMKCIITYTASTHDAPFKENGADAVREDLGGVKLADIFSPGMEETGSLTLA
eukprot:CAMPEP_0197525290 /NCGR_PEP_ID=MMETSP1318-20131121/10736_1 /TAXON_ID=552666 /ORGANISM="Partenskyella glossopodia, Strain RCC365" /LENGTH=335 /DNA_ID=CAMNT_0043078499 /DNA_START=28 /DNA_END=1035 /DNA_ORIENTATION=+